MICAYVFHENDVSVRSCLSMDTLTASNLVTLIYTRAFFVRNVSEGMCTRFLFFYFRRAVNLMSILTRAKMTIWEIIMN